MTCYDLLWLPCCTEILIFSSTTWSVEHFLYCKPYFDGLPSRIWRVIAVVIPLNIHDCVDGAVNESVECDCPLIFVKTNVEYLPISANWCIMLAACMLRIDDIWDHWSHFLCCDLCELWAWSCSYPPEYCNRAGALPQDCLWSAWRPNLNIAANIHFKNGCVCYKLALYSPWQRL